MGVLVVFEGSHSQAEILEVGDRVQWVVGIGLLVAQFNLNRIVGLLELGAAQLRGGAITGLLGFYWDEELAGCSQSLVPQKLKVSHSYRQAWAHRAG
jgi:hypothetical protein